MHWRKFFSLLGMLILLLTVLPAAAAQPPAADKIEARLLDRFAAEGASDFMVRFAEQADLSAAYTMDWEARGWFVYNTLTATAARSQARAQSYLGQAGLKYESYFSGNDLYVWGGTQATAVALAALPEVTAIEVPRTYYVDPIIAEAPASAPEALAWGIIDTNADDFWAAFGMQGDGLIVANIDTGVQWDHPALDQAFHCPGQPTNAECWRDPSNICPGGSACDNNGHGSHTMGTMVGDDDPALTWQAGMAPNATWIACKGCESNSCSEFALNTCADWIVAPNGNPNARPHVVNNSWGGSGCDLWYQAKVQAWRAAGTFPAFSAGNAGSGCSTLGSPGTYQESFASAAHDSSGTIASFSSRGPNVGSCPNDPYTKPNISAPGVSVCSSVPTNAWSCGYSGTSMASPHTAGAVALLWSCNPGLIGQIDQTFNILQDNADSGTPAGNCGASPNGGNYTYGYGYLDVYAAGLLWCGDVGYLDGHVLDAVTNAPIEGAWVDAGGPNDTTDASGYYHITLMEGTYDVAASHPLYETSTETGVSVTANATTTVDFDLQPRGWLYGYVTDYDNGFPLAGATVTADDGTTTTAGPDGYYEMYLDAGSYDVTATMTDYAPETAAVTIVAGEGTQQDFALVAAVVFIPTPLHVHVTWQDTYNEAATLTNRMAGPYDFEFREKPGGYLPTGGVLVQPPSLGTTGPVPGGTIADNPPPDWFDDSPPAPRNGIETWTLGTPIPSGPQFGNPMATADGVNFYLMGGLTSGGAYLNQTLHYDTASGVWTTMANMPTARNNTHAYYSPYDGKIYVPGGYLSGSYITNFDAYDPAGNTWQTLAPLPEGKVGVQGGVVDNKVYVLGGNNNPTTCYVYDIDAGAWSTCAPLPVSNYYGSDVVYEDMIYVIGGYGSANFLRYDPATNSWQAGPSLPQARNSPATAVSTDGILYVWGGGNGWTPYYDGMYYDLANWPGGSWTMITGDNLLDRNLRGGYACTGNQFWNTGGGPQSGAVATNQYWDGMECYFPGGGGPDVPWFAQAPVTGTVPGTLLGSLNPTMYFTATPAVGVNQPGDYYCDLIVKGDPQLTVRVTMTVEPSGDLGQVHGYVVDNCTGAPLEEVLVEIAGGLITETLTGPDGYYSAWLYAGTYEVDFSMAGYLDYSEMVTIVAGESVVLDVALVPNHPCIAIDPEMFEVWVLTGTAVYQHPTGLDIYNDGGQDLNVSVMEIDGGYAPPLAGWKPAPLPGVYQPDAAADVAGGDLVVSVPVAPVAGYVPQAVLYDNGPMVTHPGGGAGGADASALQTALGMNTYGFGHQAPLNYRMADDFVVDHPGGWQVDAITFFAYQTGSPTNPSPITAVYYQIWDGPPNDPGSSVVFGDLVTNRLVNTQWSNIYRVLDTGLGDTTRPIMADTCSAGLTLPMGTYWIEWMTAGSLSSGPWAPPISIVGQTTTGNGMQYTTAWASALDTGTNTPQGLPFVIEGLLLGGDVPWFWEVPTNTVVPATSMDNLEIYFTALNPDTTPMALGTYTATMMVTNNAGGPVEVPVTMHIIADFITPTADFTATTACFGTDTWFYFTGHPGQPAADQYTWTFGDGDSVVVAAPVPVMHTYGAAGTYTVTLEVCNTQFNLCDTVEGLVDVLPLPEAGFDYWANGLTVTFTDTSMYATAWLWEFGDGMTDTVQHPVHTYDLEGTYTVTQWAFNDCGDAMVWDVLTVVACDPVEIVTVTEDISGCVVVFGTELAGTAPITWLWDFGAWGTSTETNPVVDFGASGTYPYTLTAENCGGPVAWVDEVTVECEPPCEEVQIVTYTYNIAGCVVDFSLELTGDAPFTYLWAFGDGATSDLAAPSHTYTQTGTYNVTADVYNCAAGHDMVSFDVTVDCGPTMYYVYLPLIVKTVAP